MDSLQWTFLLAVVLMGLASAGALVLIANERCTRAVATSYGCLWLLLCFVPLGVAWLSPETAILGVEGTLDYAGAMPFPVALGVGGLMTAVISSRTRASPLLAIRWPQTLMLLAASTVGVAGWLVVAEGELNEYAITAAASVTAMALSGVVASFAVHAIRKRVPHPAAVLSAVVSALSAAVGSAAFIGLLASAGLGIVCAVIGQVVALAIARRTASGELALCAAAVTGGALSLLALGLLDRSSGFFYSGQPTLALAQLQLVGVGLAYAAAICALCAGLLRLVVAYRRRAASK